jgi:hypothetical protein
MQRDVHKTDYEIIVVDNGSTEPLDEDECRRWGADLRFVPIAPTVASPSPARALNAGIASARGGLIGVFIDGARMASPGIIASAGMASALADRAVIVTLGFHLGSNVQMESVSHGYDRAHEDQLLARSGWTENGQRLFDVSVFAGSCRNGWFSPITETNAMFMHRELWEELHGFDEAFETPGGGLVNLDTLARAVRLPEVVVVTLLGEGTFHQVHGGVATNAIRGIPEKFHAEYIDIRGRAYETPVYESLYFGSVPDNVLASIGRSARVALGRSNYVHASTGRWSHPRLTRVSAWWRLRRLMRATASLLVRAASRKAGGT